MHVAGYCCYYTTQHIVVIIGICLPPPPHPVSLRVGSRYYQTSVPLLLLLINYIQSEQALGIGCKGRPYELYVMY